jgi:streptogramin lyase
MSLALAPVKSFAQQPTGPNAAYTTIQDFSYGTLLNTTTALTPAGTTGQVQFSSTSKPFPYLYVAASNRGTLVRIDVISGTVLGEYLTAPAGNGRNPSRTTVDQLGNVWVSNRDEAGFSPAGAGTQKGSVTRIGLIIGGTRSGAYISPPWTYNTCADRDADGRIKTSGGLTTILAWPGGAPFGVDTHGGVSSADDECIINYTRVAGTGARTVAIDSNNDLWVGGTNSKHEKLNGALPPNPASGQPIMGTEFQASCGGYGGFIDKFGVLWSARWGQNLLRFDPVSGPPGVCLPISHGDYGLALDPKTCHVWHTTAIDPSLPPNVDPNDPNVNWALYTGRVVEMDAAGNVLSYRSHGKPFAQGVVVDGDGSVWVAHSAAGSATGTPNIPGIVPPTTVGHLRTTGGTFVGNVPLVDPVNPAIVGEGPTGVAVDTNGKIWVTNLYTDNVMRIDPKKGPIGGGGIPRGKVDLTVDLGANAGPYNYSDMTGDTAISNPTQGFWNVVHNGLVPNTAWGRIKWNTEPQALIPIGSTITVNARAADTLAGLTTQAFIPIFDGVPFALTGKYIEVRASLKATANAGCMETPSPIFTDLRIIASAACDADRDGDVDQNDLALISRARGQTPLLSDPRDANGDGLINAADVKACIPICTRANCATQ